MKENLVFFNEDLQNKFIDYCNLKQEKIEDAISDYEKKIIFIGDIMFNNYGKSDIETAGNDISISNSIINNGYLDLVWYDSNVDNSSKHNIVFYKHIDINMDENNLDIEKENKISSILIHCIDLKRYWNEYNNKTNYKNIPKSFMKEIEVINNILDSIEDEEIKDNTQKYKIDKIKFSLSFGFGSQNSQNYNSNKLKTWILGIADKQNVKISKEAQKIISTPILETEIIKQYSNLISSTNCIEQDYLEIDSSNNILYYNGAKKDINSSVIVNISAKSIKKLWNNHKNNLLGSNLRYYVKNKDIDEKIKETMEKNNSLFWIKNNGLVIVCSELKIVEKKLTLTNFSIINGGQTTYNIGNFDKLDNKDFPDFFILAKIIEVKDFNENSIEEVNNLISDIAESTNNQKPIKKYDILVNKPEIKEIKNLFSKLDPKIFVETKRGEKIDKSKFLYDWQVIKYDRIIQIWNSFEEIKPGSSRNQKNTLLNEKTLTRAFDSSFVKKIETYSELIKFNHVLNLCDKKKNFKRYEGDLKEKEIISFFQNGKFFAISLIRLIKIFLTFENSIYEYKKIIDNDNEEDDSSIQKKVTDFSYKYWEKIENKRIFNENLTIEQIKDIYSKLVAKTLGPTYALIAGQGNNTFANVSKTNKNFYYIFMRLIIIEFELNKETWKELIHKTGEINA